MTSRYKKYSLLANNYLISKTNNYNFTSIVSLQSFQVEFGHFKFVTLATEHALLMLALFNAKPIVKLFKHGKRLKRTVLLTSLQQNNNAYIVLDKLIHVLMPRMSDLITIKQKKIAKKSNTFIFSFKNYFETEEMLPFLTDRILRKEIFLPFNVRLVLNNNNYQINSMYLNMLRMPVLFYKNNPPLSLDDLLKMYS
jgi:hypothetical protein